MYGSILSLTSTLRWGWVVNATPCLRTAGKDLVPAVLEAGYTLGPVWTGVKNLAPTESLSPACPVCSKSLY